MQRWDSVEGLGALFRAFRVLNALVVFFLPGSQIDILELTRSIGPFAR